MKKTEKELSILELFSIPSDVMAAFDALKGFFPPQKDWDVKTRPYYNGREKGICIALNFWGPIDVLVLYTVIVNHRIGESIISYQWLGKREMNPITVDKVPDEAYRNKRNLGSPNDPSWKEEIWGIGRSFQDHVSEMARTIEVAGVLVQ